MPSVCYTQFCPSLKHGFVRFKPATGLSNSSLIRPSCRTQVISYPMVRDTGGRALKERGWGLCPSQKTVVFLLSKWRVFYAFPNIFIDTVTALTTCFVCMWCVWFVVELTGNRNKHYYVHCTRTAMRDAILHKYGVCHMTPGHHAIGRRVPNNLSCVHGGPVCSHFLSFTTGPSYLFGAQVRYEAVPAVCLSVCLSRSCPRVQFLLLARRSLSV